METWGWPPFASDHEIIKAEEIISCKGKDPRMKLAEFLLWDHKLIDEELYLQNSIELDYLYDVLLFSMSKGFSQITTCRCIYFAAKVYMETKNQTLVNAVKKYKVMAETELDNIPKPEMEIFTEYMFNTYFHHWNIYELMRTEKRNILCHNTDLHVTVPPETMPFSQAKEARIYEYEKAVEVIEHHGEDQKHLNNEKMKKELTQKHKLVKQTYKQLDGNEQPLQRNELEALIMEVASVQLSAVSLSLTKTMKNTMEDLSTMLKKAAVPRPSELGSPEKYQTKNAKVGEQKPAGRAASRTVSGVSSRASSLGKKK